MSHTQCKAGKRLKSVTERQCSLGLPPKQKGLHDKKKFLIIENSKKKKKRNQTFLKQLMILMSRKINQCSKKNILVI